MAVVLVAAEDRNYQDIARVGLHTNELWLPSEAAEERNGALRYVINKIV